MLKNTAVHPTLPVKDMPRARAFYEDVLGLEVETANDQWGVLYRAGDARLLLYESAYAGTNQATAADWTFDDDSDFDESISGLRDAGVEFDTFEMPGVTWNDGVASLEGLGRGVWFTDPEGNILSVSTSPQ